MSKSKLADRYILLHKRLSVLFGGELCDFCNVKKGVLRLKKDQNLLEANVLALRRLFSVWIKLK